MEPFKNVFSPGLVMTLAGHLARQVPGLDADRFVRRSWRGLRPLN